MATNFPGPYELRIFYNALVGGVNYDHVARLSLAVGLPVEVGQTFDTIEALGRGATLHDLDVVTDALVAVMQPQFPTSVSIARAELWEYQEDTFNASYVSAYTIGVDGTSGGAAVPDTQSIWTVRTTAGGIAKLDLRHVVWNAGTFVTYPTGNAAIDNLFAFIAAADTPFRGRDDGFLAAPFKWLPGTNERMFRKRQR